MPDVCSNTLRMKSFYEVWAGNVHEYSLKLSIGKARYLALQPQRGHTTAVVKGQVGGKVLHVRLPRAGEHDRDRVHIVLLLGGIALNVEDDFLPRLQVPGAPLFLEHGRELGVVDMAQVVR